MAKLDKQGLNTFIRELDKHINTKINRLDISLNADKVLMSDGVSVEESVNTNKTSIFSIKNLENEEVEVRKIETEESFVAVKDAKNGYFTDIKLEGKTLVVNENNEVVEVGTSGATIKSVGQDVSEISVLSCNENLLAFIDTESNTKCSYDGNVMSFIRNGGSTRGTVYFDKIYKGVYTLSFNATKTPNTANIKFEVYDKIKDSSSSSILKEWYMPNGFTSFTFTLDASKYIAISTDYSGDNIVLEDLIINKGTTPKPYQPMKQDKKRILYYNDETQGWEKPILRAFDSIEKHSDNKYYYHVRSEEVPYAEGDETKVDHITDMTTTVKKASTEKVYECTDLDLITYADETNLVIKSGVLSPKTTLKLKAGVGNVVSMLQRKVFMLENLISKLIQNK